MGEISGLKVIIDQKERWIIYKTNKNHTPYIIKMFNLDQITHVSRHSPMNRILGQAFEANW